MAQNTLGRNITFPIYNADGTAFHGLELKKATVDSVVMSLGDKVTGDVYYIDNSLAVTMQEYIVVNSVKYTLVSPPTIVREGMVADNTQLKGMTKYSFTFYHPMYQLGNIPFTDVAVTQDEEKYLSQNKTFSWIGNLFEFVQKLRANLKNTQWAIDVEIPQYEQDGSTMTPQWQKATKISDVLSFDKVFVSDALKTAYDTWEIPFVISHYESVLPSGYTRLKWVRISEIHQSVTNTTAPFWLFIYNLNSVSADNKKIHYCKVFEEDTLLFDLIPCKDSNNNVGLFDVVEGVFYGSNQEVTFVAGGEIGENKKFNITFGSPTNKIYDENGNEYVFRFGKGLGLKNNSRTPRNNKIVTRIVGYGSDRNVPYGYPQIPWTGNQSWDYTINNASGMQEITVGGQTIMAMSYPIYDGIVGGQRVRLIKHPFTRTTLMPSIYFETVNKKVNPNATGYNPDIEIKDYYDAIDDATHAYPNNINVLAPSVEVHQFEKEYPQLDEAAIISATPYDEDGEYYTYTQWYNYLQTRIATMRGQGIDGWQMQLIVSMRDNTCHYTPATAESLPSASIPAGHWEWRTGQATATLDSVIKGNFVYVTLVSSWYNETHKILQIHADPTPVWDDTMNDDGEYIQSYFKIKLPQLTFDIYACAAVTQEMNINMRSGSCMGCTFPVQVDWEAYKANFYDSNGNFAPDGAQRDLEKFPKSNLGSIDVIVQKDNDTFGTLMPNQYRYPVNGDKFVILGISLPTSYITTAEQSLDETMKEYMLENNVHYYDYPLKFDEHFLATHQNILAQIKNNNTVKFQYAGTQMSLYIKQITIKYGDKPLPQYDITLTDDVEIVLNQIGQVTDDVSRMRVQVSELQKYYSENLIQEINSKLSKIVDDVCQGRITFQQGLDSLGSVIFHDKIQSPQFEEGLYTGRGWRIDNLGNAEFESARVRSFLEIVELIVNRLQAQEGDTLFTDNDQIEKVDVIEDETDHSISYILTLKEKYQGYVTGQMYGNVVKGIINTLAAKQAGVSDYESTSVEVDGENKYYTSWMRVIGTHNTNINLGVNQIQVVLYSDDYYDDGHQGDPEHLHHFTPAGKNFAPCELMTIARWGCVDYSDTSDPNYETIKASIVRRQRMFMISTTDGRVVKYTGVDSPILKNGNYGVTIGELPEFVKNYPDVRAILNQVGEHTDWLYAQGIVVGNFIKVDIEGRPEVNIIDCGEWVNGSSTANPTPRNGIYLYNEWNSTTQQYETHDVWHNNAKWRCLQHQPVIIGDVSTYYEPTDSNSAYWQKLEQGGLPGGETIMQYALSAYKTSRDGTAQTPPSDISSTDWEDSPMATTSQKPYLWAKVQKKDGNGNNVGNPSYIRLTGEGGMSITKVSETYRYATNNTGTRPAASSSAWQTTKPTLQQGYWLYTETTITWSDTSTTILYTDERNPNDGVSGQDIIVDGATDMKYAVTNSNTQHPAESSSEWKDISQVVQTQGDWLWSKATTYYRKASSSSGAHDAGYSVNYNVSYIAIDGVAGRAIVSITEYYKATNSSTEMQVPTSDVGWSTNPNLTDLTDKWDAQHKYLWNYEKTTYSSGTTVERTKPQILAIWTADGVGIDSIVNYYKVSTKSGTTSQDSETRPLEDGTEGWADNPVAPTSNNPYLWNYEKIMYTDGSVQYTDPQMIGHYGRDGENAFVVDLENEMTNVALDENGDLIANFDMYFKVRAYYGTRNVLSDSACTVSASCSDPDVTITDTNAKTTGIRVQISSGTHILDTTEVSVTVTHTTYGTRTATFTLVGVRGGKNAVLQELLPSLDAISFARTAAGGLTPSFRDLTLSIKKTQGGSTSTQSISDSGLTIRWSATSMPASKTGGNGWGNGTATGISWNNTTMRIANTVAATNIYIAAFNSDGTLVDRETIPVVKDGNNGDDAPVAFASPEKITIQCYSNGNVKASSATSVIFTLKVGTNSGTVTSVSSGTKPTGVTVTGVSDNAVTITVGTSATASGLAPGVTFTVTGTYGGKTYSANVTVALIGSTQGEEGQSTNGKDAQYIYLKGTGLNNPQDAVCKINNGTTITTRTFSSRGLTLILINRLTLEVYSQTTYDVYGDTTSAGETQCANLATAINNASSSYFVCLVSYDAVRWTNNLIVALQSCGCKGIDDTTAYRVPFAFIGFKGLPQGYAVQMQSGQEASDAPAEVTVYVSNGALSTSKDPSVGRLGGRFYYDAGDFEYSSSLRFKVTLNEAPYFFYDNNYWVFEPNITSDTTLTTAEMGYPSSSNSNWHLMMYNTQRFLMSDAMFGKYAHFGSSIINGDWIISSNGSSLGTNYNDYSYITGKIINTETTPGDFKIKAYTLFEPSNPLKDTVLINSGTNQTISASATTETLCKPYLTKGKVYKLTVTGRKSTGDSAVYIRLMIEDDYAVEAQYAPNNNPTSSQIHTTWQDGDLYMRTKQSNETTWSSWHKIVGESGDETDFSFGISQYKTTANASTAPSDIPSWFDAPLAVTTEKPYLWAKVQQKSWNASTQAYVVDSTRYIRIRNNYETYTAIYLANTSDGTYNTTFQVETSAYYYIEMYQPTLPTSSSGGGVVTSYVLNRALFKTAYAVDLKTGISYQTQIYASGGIRSPFTYIDNRVNYNIFNATLNDNVALYSSYEQWGSGTHYALPWDASQSGRKVCITNYKWNGTEQPTEGHAVIDSESGKYFYEDGIKKTSLALSREGVELLGFGTPDEFYGWIVIKRFDLVTKYKYGRELKALAIGRYSHSNNTFSYKTFDGSQLTFSKENTGIYRIYYDKNKSWFDGADDLTAIITPLGSPLFIYLNSVQNAPATGNPYFEIYSQTTGISNGNITYNNTDGSFDVIIVNSNDWVNTQYEIL